MRADDYCWTCILMTEWSGTPSPSTPSGGCLEPRNQHAEVIATNQPLAVSGAARAGSCFGGEACANHHGTIVLVANGWDGIWASLAGGLLSRATVVIRCTSHRVLAIPGNGARDERAAADVLLIELANVRDAAVRSRSNAHWQL